MKTIGVLGGLGPQATMDFEARLHAVAQRLIPQFWGSGHPPLVVYYHRDAPVRLTAEGLPVFPIEPHPLLVEAARRLGAWADFLVLTSNGAHLGWEHLERAAGRPLLSMIDTTLAAVRERGWRRVGVLGLGEPHVYLGPLAQAGLAAEVLAADRRARLDDAIARLMEGRAGAAERAVTEGAVAELRARQVDGVILGCTEIPLLLGPSADAPDLLNPAQLLAEAAVRRALA